MDGGWVPTLVVRVASWLGTEAAHSGFRAHPPTVMRTTACRRVRRRLGLRERIRAQAVLLFCASAIWTGPGSQRFSWRTTRTMAPWAVPLIGKSGFYLGSPTGCGSSIASWAATRIVQDYSVGSAARRPKHPQPELIAVLYQPDATEAALIDCL